MSIVYDLNEEDNRDDLSEILNSDNEEYETDDVPVPRRKKLAKRSKSWQHFDEVVDNGETWAICRLCVDKVTRYLMSGKCKSSTGNLTRHLEKEHVAEMVLGEFEEEKGEFVFSQENFRKALIKWIVMCDQPFTEPKQETFVELVKTLNPDAKLISDKTVREDIIVTYAEKLEIVKDLTSKIPGKLCISFDGWTSRNILPFLAIRGHWFDANWKYNSILLDFAIVLGKHSGWKHSCIFRDCLSRLNIPITKILTVTGDNASNNNTFFDWMEEHGLNSSTNQIRCMCHIANLSVQDFLDLLKIPLSNEVDDDEYDYDNEVLEDIDMNEQIVDEDSDDEEEEETTINEAKIIVKLRQVVKKIRKSVKLRQKLKKCCAHFNIEYRVPIIDVKTRWNSTYQMMIRAKYLKKGLQTLCSHETKLASFQLDDEEWSFLSVVEGLLAKFDRATKLMSMERHSNIYSYIPTLDWLIDSVEDFSRENTGVLRLSAQAALSKLKKYKLNVNECIIPFIATVLHPALKLTYFKEQGYAAATIRDIKKAVMEYFTVNYETVATNDELQSSSDDEFRAHMFKRSRIERTSSELTKYLSLPLTSRKVDAVTYWKSQIQQFPLLSLMARDVLPSQPASTCVERDFSKGGKLVTPTRCSMLSSTIKACMSLKSWYSLE